MKKDKNSKNNKDAVDFIFDNYDSLKDGSNTILTYLKEMWIVVPDIISNFFAAVYSLIDKFLMKLRSQYAIAITNDISHLEKAKNVWDDLITKKNSDSLNEFIKTRSIGKTVKQKEYLELIRYYVKKDMKDKFLTCYVSQQHNADFILVRDELLKQKSDSSSANDTTSSEESNSASSSDSEDLDLTEIRERRETVVKDIFIASDSNKKRIKKQVVKETTSDIGATENQMSAADAYRKKFYGINK